MNAKNYIKNIASNEEHTEGPVAKAIEHQTAKLPSDTFLWLAVGSIAASATLQILGKKETSNFVGQWAPTLLILGLYNKLVKVVGSDSQEFQGTQRLGSQSSGMEHLGRGNRPSSTASSKYDSQEEGLQQSSGL